MELQQNEEVKRALNRVVRRLSNPLRVGFNEVMAEMTKYEERLGPYSLEEAPDILVANLQPHQWWSRIGREALPKIAKRVLALTCSASSCEHNWNMYSFVYNKSRNRLGTKKAEDLVYIYTNMRLLQGRLGADSLRWYENNVFSEDEDESVDDDLDMDDGDDDGNKSGGEGMEGNEPINDDERHDDEVRENIEDEDDASAFDWNGIFLLKLSKKIEIVQKEWQFLKERGPIVRTHQLHVMIDLEKTLKTIRISISVKIIILLST